MPKWILAFALMALSAHAAEQLPQNLQDVGIFPKLGNQLSLTAEFQDESGKTTTLAPFFDGKHPVALILNYYGCPMLCGLVLNQAREAFEKLDWRMGEHYKVVTISIDPKEDSKLAAAKKASIVKSFPTPELRKAAEEHWHFLVGKKPNIDLVADAVGFKYKYIPEQKQYAHGAAIFLLSPTGKLNRVLPALAISPTDLKLALLDAGEGKVGSFAEKFFALCYHYDPKESKYTILASRVMRLGGAITVALMAIAYFTLYRKRKRKERT